MGGLTCTASGSAVVAASALVLASSAWLAVDELVATSACEGDALERLTGCTATEAVSAAVAAAASSSLSLTSVPRGAGVGAAEVSCLEVLLRWLSTPSGATNWHEKDQLLSRSSAAGPKALVGAALATGELLLLAKSGTSRGTCSWCQAG